MGGTGPYPANVTSNPCAVASTSYPLHNKNGIILIILVITILLILMALLKRWHVVLSDRVAHNTVQCQEHIIDASLETTKHRGGRRPKNGLWGHTGEIIFSEACKNQSLYDLTLLLKSSVEMMGRGSLGSTYKVVVQDGSMVALKKLTEVKVKQKEFEQYVSRFGELHMKNVLPVQAYYYSSDLKFIVYEYLCLGSLFSLLEGVRRHKHTPLDWPTRLDLAIDVARALRNLHRRSIVHGNLKSSNVFMDANLMPFISEYGLVQMTSSVMADAATIGYRAPELSDTTSPTCETDVYSYGVLLMELLTGLSPNAAHNQSGLSNGRDSRTPDLDLPQWVMKTSKEKAVEDIFDPELQPTLDTCKAAAFQMLHVAIACVSEARPSMDRVLRMLEDIKLIQNNCSGLPSARLIEYESPSDSDGHSSGGSLSDEQQSHLKIIVVYDD